MRPLWIEDDFEVVFVGAWRPIAVIVMPAPLPLPIVSFPEPEEPPGGSSPIDGWDLLASWSPTARAGGASAP